MLLAECENVVFCLSNVIVCALLVECENVVLCLPNVKMSCFQHELDKSITVFFVFANYCVFNANWARI